MQERERIREDGRYMHREKERERQREHIRELQWMREKTWRRLLFLVKYLRQVIS